LYEELEKRGFKVWQAKQSKMLPAVLDILANTGTLYSDLHEARTQLDILKSQCEGLKNQIHAGNILQAREEKQLRERWEAAEHYVERFNASLAACETEEGRDAMRAAQVFVNAVSVDTKYDNTAFIIGLAAILSKNGIGAMDELKKINSKVFRRKL
jgi:hypothetical protein